MMTSKRFKAGLIALATSIYSFGAFGSGNANLSLTVSGSIADAPEWRNALNAKIESADFSFANNVAGDAARDIDSSPTEFKLFNAVSYPASVVLDRPKNCKIGANDIADTDVHFINNGSAITSNTSFDIADANLQSYKVRFSSAGNYGDKSGLVACDAGSLVYSY